MTALSSIETNASRRPVIESTLPLINIVFLLLIFFLIAGTMQSPLLQDVVVPGQSVTFDEVSFAPDEWVYAQSDGSLSFHELPIASVDLEAAMKDGRVVLFADSKLRGDALSEILRALNEASCEQVMVVTEFETDQ